jgi:predicted outer membrane repeat protein
MKNRGVFATMVLCLVFFGFLVACKEDPYETENPPVIVPGATITEKIRWLETNVQSNNRYIIEIDNDQSIAPVIFSYSGKYDITIILRGIGSQRIISLNSNGSINIGYGITFILDDKLELRGRSNNSALIRVESNAHLIMNHGVRITGNSSDSNSGSAVYVRGTFTMNGGEISGNTAVEGGGVSLAGSSLGTFIMNGGKISSNTAAYNGGGVYISLGAFIMNGGEISGNTAKNYGGGVYVDQSLTLASFNKVGGTIYGYLDEDSNSNVVKDSSEVVQNNKGHAVYAYYSSSIHKGKDITSGPEDNLSFRGAIWGGNWDY